MRLRHYIDAASCLYYHSFPIIDNQMVTCDRRVADKEDK